MVKDKDVRVKPLPGPLFRCYYFVATLAKNNRTYLTLNDNLESCYVDYYSQCISSSERVVFDLAGIMEGLTAKNPQVVGHNLSFSFRLGVYDRRDRVVNVLPNLQLVR